MKKITSKQLVKTISISLSLATLFCYQTTLAKGATAPRKYPHGCREVGFTFNDGILNLQMIPEGLEQTLYLIHNTSMQDITLRVDTNSKYVPTYEKVIPANQWAAFARDMKQINFLCTDTGGNLLNCGQVLELCNYNNVKFPETNYGTYWITKTGTQKEAMYGSIHKGVLLRW